MFYSYSTKNFEKYEKSLNIEKIIKSSSTNEKNESKLDSTLSDLNLIKTKDLPMHDPSLIKPETSSVDINKKNSAFLSDSNNSLLTQNTFPLKLSMPPPPINVFPSPNKEFIIPPPNISTIQGNMNFKSPIKNILPPSISNSPQTINPYPPTIINSPQIIYPLSQSIDLRDKNIDSPFKNIPPPDISINRQTINIPNQNTLKNTQINNPISMIKTIPPPDISISPQKINMSGQNISTNQNINFYSSTDYIRPPNINYNLTNTSIPPDIRISPRSSDVYSQKNEIISPIQSDFSDLSRVSSRNAKIPPYSTEIILWYCDFCKYPNDDCDVCALCKTLK